jgi:hypothetical protein
MKSYRANRPHKDILEDLRAERKFYEYLHLAWSLIELRADGSILKTYCVATPNPKSKPLLNLSINKKLEFFREIGYLSRKNYLKVVAFQKQRNNLFHMGGLFVLTDAQKDEIMDAALIAVDIMDDLDQSIKMTVLMPMP